MGNVVGKRRPFFGAALILAGLMLMCALLDYLPGQEVFGETLGSFCPTTQSEGANVCGTAGATFALVSLLSIGVASYMIPVYFIWVGILSFQRRDKYINKTTAAAIVFGLVLLAVLAGAFQEVVEVCGTQSQMFPRGWGGRLGTVVFESVLNPFLSVLGSVVLVGFLYLFCLVVVFVDSPREAAMEIVSVAKKSPSAVAGALKFLYLACAWPFKKLAGFFRTKIDDSDEDFQATQRRVKISVHTPSAGVGAEDSAERGSEGAEPADSPEDFEEDVIDFSEAVKKGDFDDGMPDLSVRFGDDEAENAKVYVAEDSAPDMSEAGDDDGSHPEETAAESEKECAKDNAAADVVNFDASSFEESKKRPVPAEAVPFKVDEYKPEVSRAHASAADTKSGYVFPSIELLKAPEPVKEGESEDFNGMMHEIVDRIAEFDIKVIPARATKGPVITRYEVTPGPGVRISKIANLGNDIAVGIRAQKVRIVAPIPGSGTVGIEVPNRRSQNVYMRELIESPQWTESKAEIPVALGKDITGKAIVLNLKKMPHALIAGSTGSGKSVCISSIIVSLLYKMTPEDLRFIMIDPKMVELQVYNSLPHMLIPVVTTPKKASAALQWLTSEMMRRYQIFKQTGVRNIDGFNAKLLKDKEEAAKAEAEFAQMTPEERAAAAEHLPQGGDTASDSDDESVEIPDKKLPYIVCIIDELADLMTVAGKEVEASIARITQLARAAGIHMIVATQRPDVKTVTGTIKNNLPTRIALRVSSIVDSRTILDHKGAETLIGHGDMLFLNNGSPDLVRAQGAFLSEDEIADIVNALKVNGEPQFADDVQSQIDSADDDGNSDDAGEGGEFSDPMMARAIAEIKRSGKVSTSFLQRRLGIGYGRAARIVDELEQAGKIGPDNGPGKPRDIFLD